MSGKYDINIKKHSFKSPIDLKCEARDFKINKKYLLIMNDEEAYVYQFDLQLTFDEIIYAQTTIKFGDFHCTDENIFFICDGNNLDIYEIGNRRFSKISTIVGHFVELNYASFSPFNWNILLTVSKNGCIKIYDITNTIPMKYILIKELSRIVKGMEIVWGNKNIGFEKSNSIVYFDYINFNMEDIHQYKNFNKDIANFYFLNDEKALLIISYDYIEIVKDNIKQKGMTFNDKILFSFYSQNHEVLILIFSGIIKGFDISPDYNIINTFNIKISTVISNQTSFIPENFLNAIEYCEFRFFFG